MLQNSSGTIAITRMQFYRVHVYNHASSQNGGRRNQLISNAEKTWCFTGTQETRKCQWKRLTIRSSDSPSLHYPCSFLSFGGKRLSVHLLRSLTSGVFFLNSRLWSMSFFLDCSLSSCRLARAVAVASSSFWGQIRERFGWASRGMIEANKWNHISVQCSHAKMNLGF